MEGQDQIDLEQKPGSQFQTSAKQPEEAEQVSIDLSNQKTGNQLDQIERQANQMFSKTATNEFLAASNQASVNAEHQMVSQMLDSQASSPTMKSDIALRNTAQFTNMQTYQNGLQVREPAHQATILQDKVLATSGPSHLKSQSTGNTNYFSGNGGNPGSDYEQSQITSNSQGRAIEIRNKKGGQQVQGIHGLQNLGQAKSAVLQTSAVKQANKEIKKIPSKTKVSEKKNRAVKGTGLGPQPNYIQQENSFNLPNEFAQYHHKTSYSVGKTQQTRQNSQTNKSGGYQNDSLSNQIQMAQNTPLVQHAQPMFQPSPPMPTGDQFQGFQFMTPIGQNPFQFTAQGLPNGLTAQQQQQILASSQMGYQMQPQPQVHFIAKQQKFYGISPERAPLIFKQSGQEKRPYTSSGHVLQKRTSKINSNTQNQQIAALYLGSKTHNNGFGHNPQHQQQRNQSQPAVEDTTRYQNATTAAYSMQVIPNKHSSKKQGGPGQSNSAQIGRKDKNQVGMLTHTMYSHMGPTQKLPEALQEEVLKLKQTANTHKEENIKLKTKIKILENEMGRKERTLEDFLQQNQFIQNAQKNAANGTLAPIVQTAQRYQAETFLVMSLKKQVKELKAELLKKDEELGLAKKNIKNTKFYEMDQELKLYRDELIRLRYLLEQAYSSSDPLSETNPFSNGPSVIGFHQMSSGQQSPFVVSGQNQSQPTMPTGISAGGTFKIGTNSSQTNFFPDTTSNLSQQVPLSSTQLPSQGNQYTLSHDDQVSSHTNEANPNQLPPLKKQQSQTTCNQQTPAPAFSTNIGSLDQPSVLAHQQISLSNVDTRENEFVQKLTSQIYEKDTLIRKLQQQVDEFGKQRIARLQNTHNIENAKSSSAGPSAKTELAKVKKQLREKEKEVVKLRSESVAVASQKSVTQEEQDKKVKQLQGQVAQFMKKSQEMKTEIKKKDDKNELLNSQLTQQADAQKNASELRKKEQSQTQAKLKTQVEKMSQQVEEKEKENASLNQELEAIRQQVVKLQTNTKEADIKEEPKTETKVKKSQEEEKQAPVKPVVASAQKIKIDSKVEGELGLISTVLGCRENRDRIEFSGDLIEYVYWYNLSEEEQKQEKATRTHLGLASDYKLKLSKELSEFIKITQQADLAKAMPRYDFIAPSLAMILMSEVKKMLMEPELVDIFNEKSSETKLPFDALRDLCSRFDKVFSDEHCAFITASYLNEIDEGIIFINFKEFLSDLKDPRGRDLDMTSSKHKATSSLGSEGSDSEMKRVIRAGTGSPLSDILNRSAGKGNSVLGKPKKSIDEEHMLDVAEAIFIKIADLIIAKEKTIRGIFNKYSVPEIFPDSTVLELLSPGGFLEGIKEVGIDDLQDFEIACLMRVLAKPELDNAVILNEFVMIMENFGVVDSMDDEDNDDYIPDTDLSVAQSVENLNAEDNNKDEEKQDPASADASSPNQAKDKDGKQKKKPRQHDLKSIDAKGIKILRKLARFLLKQFLHPREFFGKAITKEHIKTKKREFYIDTLKFKEFYLRIKIANIRKRLTENESLNKEICIDWKTNKDLINVKLMVKALEELAEEEQKLLLEEEKKAEEDKFAKQGSGDKKDTIGASDVETPKSSDKGEKLKDAFKDEEESKTQQTSDKDESSETGTKKESPKESYGADNIKFGNAGIRSKNSTHSPSLGDRAFVPLNTIEEEKIETQTSNYLENISERDESRLLSSNNFHGSNLNQIEFDEELKENGQKMSPELLNKILKREDKASSMSQVVSSQEINQVDTNIDLPLDKLQAKEGRLTGRNQSLKDEKISQSMQEGNLDKFKTDEQAVTLQTPQPVQNQKTEQLATPTTPLLLTEGNDDKNQI